MEVSHMRWGILGRFLVITYLVGIVMMLGLIAASKLLIMK